jgi:hypothetical protein
MFCTIFVTRPDEEHQDRQLLQPAVLAIAILEIDPKVKVLVSSEWALLSGIGTRTALPPARSTV